MEMDDNLKRLMKQLGTAINESLCDSASVSQAMTDLREAGYDIFVILEATIGFNRRPGRGSRCSQNEGGGNPIPLRADPITECGAAPGAD